jgi:phosphatidylinositol alpha-1,6-mannosyltransferase
VRTVPGPLAPHLLVTNDFPPKVGGIQSYLYELWRRLPPDSFAVLTRDHPGAGEFDAAQPFAVERMPAPLLAPGPRLVRRVRELARARGARLVVLDPALPLGLAGPALGMAYAVVLHGAEATVPAHLPGARQALRRVLAGASLVVACGHYPASVARRVAGGSLPRLAVVPPGVDHDRFRPLGDEERAEVRRRFRLAPDARLVLSVSRLVPRKGMDVLIRAAGRLHPDRPDLCLAVAGQGRDRARLALLGVRCGAPLRLLGPVQDRDLPALYGCADVFAMLCRNRWGGLEQEGFGIVFLEAAACGVPQVAGDSGGSREAVEHGTTGLVVSRPSDTGEVAAALARLLDDEGLRRSMGRAARERAVSLFDYPALAARLARALGEAAGSPGPAPGGC